MTKNTEKPLYSHHIFLFPFRWEYLNQSTDIDISKRFDISKFDEYLDIAENNPKQVTGEEKKWTRKPYQLIDDLTYNEFNYFYDYVREVMYDLGDDLLSQKSGSENILRHYEYNLPHFKTPSQKSFYVIKIKYKDKEYLFKLEIEDILLNIYNTGIGLLSFHLLNRRYSEPEEILAINQYGRRTYPPFLRREPNSNKLSTESDELSSYIALSISKSCSTLEYFGSYKEPNYFEKSAFQLPVFIKDLFPDDILTPLEKERTSKNISNKRIQMLPALDDRMFIICWYGSDKLVKYGAEFYKPYINAPSVGQSNSYKYETNPWWYKYIFVDAHSVSCQDDNMRQYLLRKHTYSRWANWGTLYGASRYSFVGLTSSLETLKRNNADFLYHHVTSLYYKLVELCLVQRASIIRFSDEITHLTNFAKEEQDGKLVKRVSDLYKHYIQFVNKINFREVTAQEQGIELYDLMREHMKLERDVKDLGAEFEELNNYVSLIQERRRNDRLELLTIIGSIVIIPSLVAAVFGFSHFPSLNTDNFFKSEGWWYYPNVVIPLGIMILSGWLGYIVVKRILKN